MNLYTKQKQIHGHREGTYGCQAGRAWEGCSGRFSRCKLLYIEWINKVLLYSTENYIQYPMINHNGEYF